MELWSDRHEEADYVVTTPLVGFSVSYLRCLRYIVIKFQCCGLGEDRSHHVLQDIVIVARVAKGGGSICSCSFLVASPNYSTSLIRS